MDAGLGAARIGGKIAAHRVHLVHHDPGMIEQALARRGQFDAAPAALQKRNAQGLFEPLDACARRGQREMDLERAARDAARIGHRDE